MTKGIRSLIQILPHALAAPIVCEAGTFSFYVVLKAEEKLT
jgi:hypothetical protein